MSEFLIILAGGVVKGEDGQWRTTLGQDELGHSGILNDRLRVVAAAALWKENNNLRIIASGGQGKLASILPKDLMTSQVLHKELVELGVPAEKIIEERKSGTTFEQLVAIKRMIESGELSGEISVISNNYHLPRIQAMIDYTDLKKTLAGKVKLIGAEDVLLRFLPNEWREFIEKSEKSEAMKNRLEAERRGVEQIKSGTYKFSQIYISG